jgi:hypothetical protein
MTYLSKACAALVLAQAGALDAQAQTPPAKRLTVDELVNGILKEQDKKPNSHSASPPAGAGATFRQVADAAVRNVMDSRCQPWPLPPEKYDSWRTITFNFDSRDY